MDFHCFDVVSTPAAPWKNGGGTTRELVCRPARAGIGGFDWRVSIATIAAAGPFSIFPGVDRVIVLLEGAGVQLRSSDGCIDHRLDAAHAPFAFPGDIALDCALLGGSSTDFNVMTRRELYRADVHVLGDDRDILQADGGVLLALRGAWRLRAEKALADVVCRPGNGLWWDGARCGWHAAPHDADAALVAVRISSNLGST